jgi:hypothetical protein
MPCPDLRAGSPCAGAEALAQEPEALAKAGNNIGGIPYKSVTYRWLFCDTAIKVGGIY